MCVCVCRLNCNYSTAKAITRHRLNVYLTQIAPFEMVSLSMTMQCARSHKKYIYNITNRTPCLACLWTSWCIICQKVCASQNMHAYNTGSACIYIYYVFGVWLRTMPRRWVTKWPRWAANNRQQYCLMIRRYRMACYQHTQRSAAHERPSLGSAYNFCICVRRWFRWWHDRWLEHPAKWTIAVVNDDSIPLKCTEMCHIIQWNVLHYNKKR